MTMLAAFLLWAGCMGSAFIAYEQGEPGWAIASFFIPLAAIIYAVVNYEAAKYPLAAIAAALAIFGLDILFIF